MTSVADRYRTSCGAGSGCRTCGGPLRSTRAAYCSVACGDAFERNHFWGAARAWALHLWAEPGDPKCRRCGEAGLLIWPRGRRYTLGRRSPEVNHIAPLNRKRGKTYHFGCFNHQSNLEVLCHGCHVRVTVEQRAAGLIGKPRRQLALALHEAQDAATSNARTTKSDQ